MRRLALALTLALIAGTAYAEDLSFVLRIEHGRLPAAMRLIRVHQGDQVRLRWSSDAPLELHLHGYDIEKRVVPGGTVEMAFTAHATGRFPVEIHDGRSETTIAQIEVYPR